MSGAHYNHQQQAYGGHRYQESSEPAQYMQQNYGYHNQGFVPPYQSHSAFATPGDEYRRQPAASPYPTAPMPMPEPAPVLIMPEPPPAAAAPTQEPRVIIVQQPPSRGDDCCGLICGCIDWIITRICQFIVALIVIAVLIGLAIWLLNKYRRH